MTFYTLTTLKTETMRSWAEITKEIPKENFKLATPAKEIERGFKAYQTARESKFSLIILGGPKVREDDKLIINFGTLATDPQYNQKKMREVFTDMAPKVKAPLGEITNNNQQSQSGKTESVIKKVVKDHLHKGSIVNDSNWWIYRNDMFMIGGIHGQRSFHIAEGGGEMPADDLLWDKAEKRPRVLGRELIMLKLAGYQRIAADENLGIVFAPPSVSGSPLTLKEFRAGIAKIKSVDEIEQMFDSKFSNNCERLKV